MTIKTKQEIETGLNQWTGTESYHRVAPGIVMTDGVKWLCESAECFWLMTAIASHQCKALKNKELSQAQFWSLRRNGPESNGAVLTCETGNEKVVIRQKIPETDFPLDSVKLYCMAGGDGRHVILLPSEY